MSPRNHTSYGTEALDGSWFYAYARYHAWRFS
jgi:hypothetical protein